MWPIPAWGTAGAPQKQTKSCKCNRCGRCGRSLPGPEDLFRQRLAENPWIHRQREYSPPNPPPKGAIHRQRVEFSAKGNDSPPESLWQRIWQRSAKSTARSTAKGKFSSAKSPLAEIPPNPPPEVHSQVMPGANPLAWNAHLNPD